MPLTKVRRLWQALRRGIVRVEDVDRHYTILGGTLRRDRMSLFSIFRDEMFFCPAFFDHYRRIGVEQFVILDDGSTDGTREFLLAQSDCVVLAGDIGFSDRVLLRLPNGRLSNIRGGVFYKIAVPHHLFCGLFTIYADADEFLLLPPGVAGLRDIVERLEDDGAAGAVASLVEFFPERFADLSHGGPLESFDALLGLMGYFEAEPLLRLDPDGRYMRIAPSKSMRLFDRFGVKRQGRLGRKPATSPRHKTPLLRHTDTSLRIDSHRITAPVSPSVMLAMAHFVFTPQSRRKAERALARKAHSKGAEKYRSYAELYATMSQTGASFLSERSQRYAGPEDLVACGLMRW